MLVVDDDPDHCASLASLLRIDGYVVEVATDGSAAITALERQTPGVVILDITLQAIDGVHIATYLRKHWPVVRIIIFSGSAENVVRSRFNDYDAFMTKSESPDQLLATVARLAGSEGS